MKLEWSAAALADLDRFAAFLHERHPRLAKIIASAIKDKARILSEHPLIGRAIVARMNEVKSGIGGSDDISFPGFRSAQPGPAAAMKSSTARFGAPCRPIHVFSTEDLRWGSNSIWKKHSIGSGKSCAWYN